MSYDSRYAKQWRLDHHRGICRYLEATEVRNHIATLTGAGASYRAIAECAELSVQAVSRLAHGQKQVRRTTATKILAVTTRAVRSRDAGDKFVPDIGTRRRIQALMTMGHGHADIAEAAGMGRNARWTANLLHQPGTWVTQANARAVCSAYRRLCTVQGSNGWAKSAAARHGYLGPLAWDDIDDPHAVPELTVPEIGEANRRPGRRPSVNLEDLEWILDQEVHTWESLPARLGARRAAIERAAYRAGRNDLIARVTATTHAYVA